MYIILDVPLKRREQFEPLGKLIVFVKMKARECRQVYADR